MKALLPVALSAVMTVIGIACLVWPSKIQQYALRSPSVSKFNPFFQWMKRPAYVVSLRLCGVLALVVAAFLLWAVITNRA
jgi:uncharacterized protein YjeT (DUF2065 family)